VETGGRRIPRNFPNMLRGRRKPIFESLHYVFRHMTSRAGESTYHRADLERTCAPEVLGRQTTCFDDARRLVRRTVDVVRLLGASVRTRPALTARTRYGIGAVLAARMCPRRSRLSLPIRPGRKDGPRTCGLARTRRTLSHAPDSIAHRLGMLRFRAPRWGPRGCGSSPLGSLAR